MFEADLATEPLDSHAANAIREKILVYESHQDAVLQWWKDNQHLPRPQFRVVFLTTTIVRASHILWLANECASNKDRRLCYAAAQDDFLAVADALHFPLFHDHHGGWQPLINLHPSSHFLRSPIRLTPPVTILGLP